MEKPIEKRLGEIAFRVNDIEIMTNFYKDTIQLELLRKEPQMVFFKISDGFQGHQAVLALFKRGDEIVAPGSLDHVAFSIDLKDFEPEKERLTKLGFTVETAQHNWTQWKSLYINDPEGNRVEFVCYDAAIPKNFES